ncbi:SOS response-associated peptidase [Luxibacter massiliensis]|uniref:SOS response-associated peptidase n=1 Tax=Luxibacter massiliensis TaxID=2219695 RepID=UPI000F0469D5|nr:SOS response-associated peptidase [Luxibacter massiliensis]
MCGRYYVDDEAAREIENIVKTLDQKLKAERMGDVCPSQSALVLAGQTQGIVPEIMQWGFPGFQGNRLLINARSEGVLEKKTFRDSVLHRRCVIPAKGFYEWNDKKEKYQFERQDGQPVLFMAGCFQIYQGQERFVILTTGANSSVSPVHGRMPLILEPGEWGSWILDDGAVENFLRKTPAFLKKKSEYQQLSLF